MRLITDRDKVAHLLRRFGLGASEVELDYYVQGGVSGAIDKLLNYEKHDEGFDIPVSKFAPQADRPVNMQGLQAWWTLRLLTTRRPLQEKMTLFWHDHFATSAQKVVQPPFMYEQNEILRRNAVGSFKTMLTEVSKDPAMLFWLDNQENVRGKPNENFAREVMELFTLGIGHYTEKDVQEAARAFTGWSFQRKPRRADLPNMDFADFILRPRLHDDGEKTVLGKTGNLSGEDVIDILCDHAQTAKYITEKIWNWFVYPDPDAATVEKYASKFRSSGLSIKALLQAIMKSSEFYSEKAVRAVYKNPVDFAIPTLRQLGVGETALTAAKNAPELVPPQARGPVGAVQQTLRSMGMTLLFPPDVNGWEGGAGWISSATMVERIGWADRVFGQASPTARRAQVRFPAFPLLREDPTPKGVVAKLLSVFDVTMPLEKVKQLEAAAEKESGGRVTAQNANATASRVTELIFGSPEFQLA